MQLRTVNKICIYPVIVPMFWLTLACDDNSTRAKCTIPTHDDNKKKQSGTAVIVTPPNKTRVSIRELSAHTEDSCPRRQVSYTCAHRIFDPPEGRIRWTKRGREGGEEKRGEKKGEEKRGEGGEKRRDYGYVQWYNSICFASQAVVAIFTLQSKRASEAIRIQSWVI